MLTMDVFNSDAFTARSLTAAVDRLGFVPTLLQTLPKLVTPVPVRSELVMIEGRGYAPALIQTSPRGSAPKQESGDNRDLRAFRTFRLADASRITASELLGIRAFGSESELKQLLTEVARRQMKIKQNFQLTRENWYLGMVQGKLADADGTVLYDWATEFGQTRPAEVAFGFSAAADGDIIKKCNQITRTIKKNLKGIGGVGVRIVAICSDEFWDALTQSTEVRKTFLNWQSAQDLRNDHGMAWSAFTYGGIEFVNYRGSDGAEVAVPASKAKFFPVGAGIFQEAHAPAEAFDFVNTPGQEMYSWVVPDRDRNMFADIECYSYPLTVCVQPSALMSGGI